MQRISVVLGIVFCGSVEMGDADNMHECRLVCKLLLFAVSNFIKFINFWQLALHYSQARCMSIDDYSCVSIKLGIRVQLNWVKFFFTSSSFNFHSLLDFLFQCELVN